MKKLHPITKIILYGDIHETDWNVIDYDYPTSKDFYDEEQLLRIEIAATVQKWLETHSLNIND